MLKDQNQSSNHPFGCCQSFEAFTNSLSFNKKQDCRCVDNPKDLFKNNNNNMNFIHNSLDIYLNLFSRYYLKSLTQ